MIDYECPPTFIPLVHKNLSNVVILRITDIEDIMYLFTERKLQLAHAQLEGSDICNYESAMSNFDLRVFEIERPALQRSPSEGAEWNGGTAKKLCIFPSRCY